MLLELQPQNITDCGREIAERIVVQSDSSILDEYDTAMIVSADSDLVPVIEAIRELFPTISNFDQFITLSDYVNVG